MKILKSHHPHLLPAIVMLFLLNSTAVYGQNEITAEQVQKIRTAAERGDAQAQSDLARYYGKGTGVVQDGAEAVKWWTRAAEQGHAESQYILGILFSAGRVVEKDAIEAARWFRLAAEQGHPAAQRSIGAIHEAGEVVRKDLGEALSWYRLSAAQGNADAQVELGRIYAEGVGVIKNDRISYDWYRKAAEAGNMYGQAALAWHYYSDNKLESYKWLLLAKSQGFKDDVIEGGLLFHLTKGQREEEQRLAAEWQADFEKRQAGK